MRPDERLHPRIVHDVKRYISYHWGNPLIIDLVHFRYGVSLRAKCIDRLRNDEDCSPRCVRQCVFDE